MSLYYVPSPFLGIEVRMGKFPQKLSKIYATLDGGNLNEVRNEVI